jgi:hypothetical protein
MRAHGQLRSVPFKMQSSPMRRKSHHANDSRSLFQNPWTQTTVEPSQSPTPPLPEIHDSDSDANSTPDNILTPTLSSSPVTFLGLPSLPFPTSLRFPSLGSTARAIPISIERVRALECQPPHPPVKVVKPDWGRDSSASSSLKATWLGHAVCPVFYSPARCSSPRFQEFSRRVPELYSHR